MLSLLLSVLALFLLATGTAAFVAMVKGFLELRRLDRHAWRNCAQALLKSPLTPAVSVVAAAAEATPDALLFVRHLLGLEFGVSEVALALNGPSEAALAVWTAEFHLRRSARAPGAALPTTAVQGVYESTEPIRLVVTLIERGSDDEAMNAAANVAISPLIACFDVESEFDSGALLRLMPALLEAPEETLAVFAVAPPPDCRGLAGLIGSLEALRTWLARCAALADWNMAVPVPGSCAVMRRDAVIRAGGFRGGVPGLASRLHRVAEGRAARVVFVPEPVSRLVPASRFADLRRAAARDQKEIRSALGTGLGAPLGTLAVARVVRPAAETAVYGLAAAGLLTGSVETDLLGLVLLATSGTGIVLSMAALALGELASREASRPGRLAALFLASFPENLGYRQLRNLWLIAGFLGSRDAAAAYTGKSDGTTDFTGSHRGR